MKVEFQDNIRNCLRPLSDDPQFTRTVVVNRFPAAAANKQETRSFWNNPLV